MAASEPVSVREHLRAGQVIPAHPLALTPLRTLDEDAQRALTRYYMSAGAGGIAVGVHTTQFAIRRADVGLYRPVLELAAEVADDALAREPRPFVKVAGICGGTAQALTEAQIAVESGYDVGLVSPGEWLGASEAELLAHYAEVAEAIPVFGFYLQPAVGGRYLSYRFWRELAEIPGVWAIKIAPFNRYATSDVVRAVIESGRDDLALYTGNDDNIVADLLTPFTANVGGVQVARWIDGGLLGQWAMWTHAAVMMLKQIQAVRATVAHSSPTHFGESPNQFAELLREGAALTDANAAIFDAANGFAGCIPGIHEVLRREGLLRGTWCLDPGETLSPGQLEEIERVYRSYPTLRDTR